MEEHICSQEPIVETHWKLYQKTSLYQLAPSTPSELIAIADEVESKRVDLDALSLFLPEVPIEDQIAPGIGWETFEQQKRGGSCDFRKVLERWKEITESERNGARKIVTLAGSEASTKSTSNAGSGTSATEESATSKRTHNDQQEDDEEELEEWEIEAEKHLQDSNEIAPAPPVKSTQKSKKAAEITYNRQQMNAIMEQAVIQPLSFDQEQVYLLLSC